MKTTDEVCEIISFGGGVLIDAATRTMTELCTIAGSASDKSTIIIKNADRMSTKDICDLVSIGRGSIICDLVS